MPEFPLESKFMYSKQLQTAVVAARIAGAFLKEHFYLDKNVNESSQFDIKLELDVKSQELITQYLLSMYPDYALYGEEGIAGNSASAWQWVVDPIDGTVNYFYGIPHYCVSIALRYEGEVVLGVIYDPMQDELWKVQKGGVPTLNDRPIHVSDRTEMNKSIVFIGPGKHGGSLEKGLERFAKISHLVRKIRITGSAALALAYIATGRYDSYVESTIFLWDIAAGALLVEAAGGKVKKIPCGDDPNQFSVIAWNGLIPIETVLDEA